ncbi:MAG: hypothetical protein NC308_05970 [Clostridium sp.]|nr:hypothetical protein [Bacteroides sp.]MCM1198416.1 hypothetical protein [Clostridium sp.]
MISDSGVEVSSKALIDLQGDLNSLSDNLQELYEVLSRAMSSLNEDWRDDKYEEFEQEFRSSKELIMELSEKYREWANQYLPPRIELIIEAEKMRMGIK